MYINYEYTQTNEIAAIETYYGASPQFQKKDTKSLDILKLGREACGKAGLGEKAKFD